jgi:hypothetical protein
MKTVSFQLEDPVHAKVVGLSRKLGKSKSQFIRQCVESATQNDTGVSLHDLMSSVCGKLKGPKDLSENRKKHLTRHLHEKNTH